jgi:uncharacterized DUF497 family protein
LRYRFDWDPAMETQKVRKHKLSFRRAASVFRNPSQLSVYDEEHSETGGRWAKTGIDRERVLQLVVHTFEQVDEELCEVRIMYARRATGWETE